MRTPCYYFEYGPNSLRKNIKLLSRNSPVIIITNDISIKEDVNCGVIYILENKSYSSLLGIIPIQLLAYNLSINKGINPDKPKKLAKAVTVE